MLYRKFNRLRDPARFRGWLIRIAFRLALDRWRAARRREKRETEWFVSEQRPVRPTAEDLAASREFRTRLERALEELPEKQRLVLLLSAMQGYTLEKVAGILDIPIGTVKSRLFFVALVVLAVAMGIELRRSATPDHAILDTRLVAHAPGSESPAKTATPRVLVPSPHLSHARITPKTSVPAPSPKLEVLVLREEQEGFARFVSELSNDRDAALALASATPAKDDVPMEIALLTIERVEVELLEGSSSE